MNAESSDWKRYIPISDELNSIYSEMESIAKEESFDKSSEILPPRTNRHIQIFGSTTEEKPAPHIEQQLQ